ncbi:hypothetical protein ACK3SF_03275 [Candidatus Nanosalina sp. VS9-1]|uniref:hypothetical protein n=1 Tax=Candidatus Nanosalina sp. VS9-1 TaxID=3388566 RepID=UPI0039E1FB29
MTGNDESSWMVFQTDVLDVLRQYEGYMDHSERVGSLRDDSRPDFVGRITRKGKKEVWVVDAKNKPEINSDDRQRMEKYLEMLKSNPIDLGLELNEASNHEFRGIFVTSAGGKVDTEKYEHVNFKSIHQFLQKELVYTDTEKVVRDVAKMLERKQLSQSQARLLSRSLKPFEDARKRALNTLEELETSYIGLDLDKAPFEKQLPVEAKLTHEHRNKIFLIDIPYSREALRSVPGKVEEAKNLMQDSGSDVFFAALDTFDADIDSPHVLPLNKIEEEIREEASIMSPVTVAELFTPKISTQRKWHDGYIEIEDTHEVGFKARVATENDVKHRVEVHLNSKALESIKERKINARKDFGQIKNGKFQIEFEITEDREIKYGDTVENISSFRDTVKTVYQASVSPVLSRKVKASMEM